MQDCVYHNIKFVCLPPNSTHILQPLDVAFYAPLKRYWREILTELKLHAGRHQAALTKDCLPPLLNKLVQKPQDSGRGPQNLISGFSKTGLYPIKPSRPKERVLSGNVHNEAASYVIIDILRSMHGPDTVGRKQNRKRLNVEPGKSVTADDIATLTEISISHSSSSTSINNCQSGDLELDLQSPTTCNTSKVQIMTLL